MPIFGQKIYLLPILRIFFLTQCHFVLMLNITMFIIGAVLLMAALLNSGWANDNEN